MTFEQETEAAVPAPREPSAFARSEPAEARLPKRRGRPPSHAEAWTKVTVVLMDRQIVFLDRLVAEIRDVTGATIRRAHIIRALTDALANADLDLSDSRSEKELMTVLTTRLRRGSAA